VRAIRQVWRRLRLDWQDGLGRLPSFTQRTAVLLVGVLVAALAMIGGVVALVGWPGASGPTHLVPGGQAGPPPPTTQPRPGGGAAVPPAAAPAPARSAAAPGGGQTALAGGTAGGTAGGAQGSGGAAGAGAGGPSAAPPTTTTLAPGRPLDPVEELLGPVVSTLPP
jgi:hypothetical protein